MFSSCRNPCCGGEAEDTSLQTKTFEETDETRKQNDEEAAELERQRLEAEATQRAIKEEEEKRRREEAAAAEAEAKQKALAKAEAEAKAKESSAPKEESASIVPEVQQELPFQDRMYKEALAKMTAPMKDVPGKMKRRPSSENISFDDYTKKHAAFFEKILELERPDGWNLVKEDQGVKVYTKAMPGTPLLYFKGVSDFTCKNGPFELVSQIITTEDRPKWDELCEKGETPQFFPPFYKCAYARLKPQAAIISGRDLLTLGRLRFEQDGAITLAMKSETLAEVPEVPGVVRINIVEAGYIVRPTSQPTVYTVTWTGCADPKGWLPIWLVNLVVKKQAMTLAKIKGHIASLQK